MRQVLLILSLGLMAAGCDTDRTSVAGPSRTKPTQALTQIGGQTYSLLERKCRLVRS